MYSHLNKFIRNCNIINESQFGFQSGKSTTDAILKFTQSIYDSFNDGRHGVAVLLDFQKAFDTVNHSILLRKMERLGVRGLMRDWFESYLSNRKQYVQIEDCLSGSRIITSGVPQGSVLGGLIFLLCINDMVNCCNDVEIIQFADDKTFFFSNRSVDLVVETMNSTLVDVDTWLQVNRLSLNIDKTNYILFSNVYSNLPNNIIIRNSSISLVTSAKFLGIIIDNRLNFSEHVRYTCNKISKTIGIMKRLSSFVPAAVLRTLYNSLVLPYLTYGVELWGAAGKVNVDKIKSVQIRSLKLFAPNIVQSNSAFSLFHHHGILYFNSLFVLFSLIFLAIFCLRLESVLL